MCVSIAPLDHHTGTGRPARSMRALTGNPAGQEFARQFDRRGHGIVEISLVGRRAAITRARAVNPLKLLTPRRRNPAAWVYTSTFGGGLVAGDKIELDVHVRSGASGVLTTQASTKVYKNPARRPCGQLLRATVGDGGLLVVVPDPVTCFAGALFDQRQRFDVRPGGDLVVVDWLTSGRRARGECWAFTRYHSRIDLHWGPEHLLADAVLLDPADGPIDSPHRLGRFHCLATLLLVGDRMAEAAERMFDEIDRQPVQPGKELIETASPIGHGVILRIIGMTTEQVANSLRKKLSFLSRLLGDTPWARKW